jgi:hypothetical protein
MYTVMYPSLVHIGPEKPCTYMYNYVNILGEKTNLFERIAMFWECNFLDVLL